MKPEGGGEEKTLAKPPPFKRVGESLYRYLPTGVYYARLVVAGKEIRQSLRTKDQALAKRRLADLRNDLARIVHSAGRLTLAALVDRYLATMAHQSASTLVQKRGIADEVKRDWPGAADVDIRKVVRSQPVIWVAGCSFGGSSRNHHLRFVRACFELAVRDRLLASSRWRTPGARRQACPCASRRHGKSSRPSSPTFARKRSCSDCFQRV